MNYKVLYRKYRPNDFDSLIGQNHIVEILKNSIKNDKISHAYIFSGPRGTGKTSTARILAKSVNCLNPKDGCACGECENCKLFSSSPDIIEIDAASNNGVDEIRELINNVKIMPTSFKYKVYIIDEVHMLSTSAFNALLLTLEEPPEHVIFILATTNIENVPITILSRCQKFDFKRITVDDMLERLKYICKEEKIDYEENALKEIAIIADGGLRDALGILDQLSKNEEKITLDLVTKEIGTVSKKEIENLIKAIDDNDLKTINTTFTKFQDINLNYKVIIKKLIEVISEISVKVLENNKNSRLTFDDYKHMVMELNEVMNKVNISTNPYILIKMILLSYFQKDNNIVISKVSDVKELPKEEPKKEEVKTEVIKEKPQEENVDNSEFINIRINNSFVDATKTYLSSAKKNWTKLVSDTTNMKIKGLIADTIPVTSSNEYTIIQSTIDNQTDELNNNIDVIEKEYKKVTDDVKKIIFIDKNRWDNEKKNYITKIKDGYKYELMPEVKQKKVVSKKNPNNLEKIAQDIFCIDKIEIEGKDDIK